MHDSGQTPFDPALLVKKLSDRPGVYRMLGRAGEVLYVGKAGNLRRRLASYFRRSAGDVKLAALMSQVQSVDLTVTATEGEALILESNLIKAHRPRYNVVLRDDKSYPYIYLSAHPKFPRLGFHRGPHSLPGRYFGPYPGAGAVRETLRLLQKLFRVRQCEDSFFDHRSRPCLQHQIGRCTAPCVGLITPQGYHDDLRHAVMFLESKSQQVIEELAQRMESAAVQLEFERAARYRDQIASLRRVHERQYASVGEGDVDIVAAATRAGTACILLMFVRGGRWLGDRVFSPRVPEPVSLRQVLEAFLAQHYVGAGSDREIPRLIVVNQALPTAHSLGAVLSQQCGHEVRLVCRPRGEQAHWLQTAETNVEQALQRHLASRQNRRRQVDQLREVLGVGTECRRMECFDISHSTGEAAVAACVVFDENGPVQSDYRRFNIEGITPGDDYAALRQALSRRYKRLLGGEGKLPDLLFIDGGAGQMAAAQNILRELQVSGVRVVGVAKGPDRRPGHEVLYLGDTRLGLTADSPALHWVQQIRDEAHRFAITGHRQRRARRRAGSPLERIAGVGPGRRRALLRHFGGLQEVARTGVEDLARVPGISRHLAQRIYDALHCAD